MYLNKKSYLFFIFVYIILIGLLVFFLIMGPEISFAPGDIAYGEGNFGEGLFGGNAVTNLNLQTSTNTGPVLVVSRNQTMGSSNNTGGNETPLSEGEDELASDLGIDESKEEKPRIPPFAYWFIISLLVITIILVSVLLVYYAKKDKKFKISNPLSETIRFINNKNLIRE